MQSPRPTCEIVLSSLSGVLIGRKYYSDRDPPVPVVEQREPESL
ncbi:hypothetical protein [Halapricum desulfuricans]|nr:hypothetical protein [Halapricum desulfuricans]